MAAQAVGIAVMEETPTPAGQSLTETIAEYLGEVRAGKSRKTHAA